MKKCPKCGTGWRDGRVTCEKCGLSILPPMKKGEKRTLNRFRKMIKGD